MHIGAPKTGSTALQRFFFANRAELLRRGVLYPDVSLRGGGHHDLAFLLDGGYPEWATPQPKPLGELAAELRGAVRGHDGAVLLSSEDFYLCPQPERLRELLASTGVLKRRRPVVIVYVRRQDDAHESWYNQTIKAQGAVHDVETCYARWYALWDYREQLARWATTFGDDALVVRPYERSSFAGGTLVRDALCVLGLAGEGFATAEERVNTGLNADLLEFQRLMNALPLAVPEKRAFHRELIELSSRAAGSGTFDERPALGPARRREIRAAYAEANREVARRYLGRDELFLEEPSDGAEPAPRSGLDADKLALVMGWLLARGAGVEDRRGQR